MGDRVRRAVVPVEVLEGVQLHRTPEDLGVELQHLASVARQQEVGRQITHAACLHGCSDIGVDGEQVG